MLLCFLSVLSVSTHSLAQQDAVLQTLHEVVPDPFARHILNPHSQLLFLLGVVLPCELRGQGTTSEIVLSQYTTRLQHDNDGFTFLG